MIHEFNFGEAVICDICGVHYTDSLEIGGFLFGSNAYCPECSRKAMPDIERFGEEHLIRARCPDGLPFAEFVRHLRHEHFGTRDCVITLRTGEDALEMFDRKAAEVETCEGGD